MAYCPNAKKTTIYYSFANKNGRYISEQTPIDIEEKHDGVNFTGGQCKCMVYIVTATAVQSGREPIEVGNKVYGEIIDAAVTRQPESEIFVNGDPNECRGSFNVLCRGFPLSGFGCQEEYQWVNIWNSLNCKLDIDFVNIRITPEDPNQKDNCGNPPLGKCTIKVNHNNQTIFAISGDSPCSYSVACDDECPPGTTKCLTTNYPGYCCLPCKEIAGEIKAIANQVRRLNNG